MGAEMSPLFKEEGIVSLDNLPRRIRKIKLFTDNSSPIFQAVSYKIYRAQSITSIDSRRKKKATVSVYLVYDPIDSDGEVSFDWTGINPEVMSAIIGNRNPWFVSEPIWIQHMFRCWVSFYYLIDADKNKRSCRKDESPNSE